MENQKKINEKAINYSYINNKDIKEIPLDDKLSKALNLIKKDIFNFLSKSIAKGFILSIKINDKKELIKLFITLIKNSDTNERNEDIDFLIEADREYPEKPPRVFCLSCVKSIFKLIFNIFYLVFRYC